jgi:hypothetical protein
MTPHAKALRLAAFQWKETGMNRRILKNAMLALGLSAAAVLMPAQESEAQSCSPNCQLCLATYLWYHQQCTAGCSDQACNDQCYQDYIVPALATCYQY